MSFDLLYDKQFIKLEKSEAFIPMVLAGSSNCYEWSSGGRERRERSWFPLNFVLPTDKKLFATMDEMLKRQNEYRDELIERSEDYNDKSFGYYSGLALNGSTGNSTFGMYQGIVRTGCKKALTIEQLKSEGVSVSASIYGTDFHKAIVCEDDVLELLKRDDAGKISFGYSGMFDEKPKRIRKKYFAVTRERKETVQQDSYKTIVVEDKDEKRYFVRKTKWGYRYSPYPYHKLTDASAKRKLSALNRKYGHSTMKFVTKTIYQTATVD